MMGQGGAYTLSSGYVDRPGQPPNGRVLVFKLGGAAKLPAWKPMPVAPANPPKGNFTEAQISHGAQLFEGNCGVCHGGGARSSGVLPDLRRSVALSDAATWQSIVHDGALKDQGMIAFGRWMSKDDIEAIRAYVGVQAKYLASTEGKAGR
jgi:quinohemoprotein ethanol dehydrogenase